MSNRAWVTLATNDSYGLGALVLAHSLRRAGSVYPAVVLITPSVTDAMRERLGAVFAEVITVDVLDSKDAAHLALLQRPELGITFTKIHCWSLTQYEKCVFLDADILVIQNCDELFEREELSAAPDVGWPDCFNSGVFVFQPSKETFEKLIQFAQQRGSFDGGDQGLLNSFFADWAHGDINKHLPFLYNVTSAAFYSYLPALKHYGQNLKIIHFIGAAKPWLQHFNWGSRSVDAPGHLQEFLQLWWDLFVSQVHTQLDVSMVEVESSEEAPPEHPPALPPQDINQHLHYQPVLDPESEFPWHRPDTRIPDVNYEQINDFSEFPDPWNIYGGNIPPIENAEGQDDLHKYVWEYRMQEQNQQQAAEALSQHQVEDSFSSDHHNQYDYDSYSRHNQVYSESFYVPERQQTQETHHHWENSEPSQSCTQNEGNHYNNYYNPEPDHWRQEQSYPEHSQRDAHRDWNQSQPIHHHSHDDQHNSQTHQHHNYNEHHSHVSNHQHDNHNEHRQEKHHQNHSYNQHQHVQESHQHHSHNQHQHVQEKHHPHHEHQRSQEPHISHQYTHQVQYSDHICNHHNDTHNHHQKQSRENSIHDSHYGKESNAEYNKDVLEKESTKESYVNHVHPKQDIEVRRVEIERHKDNRIPEKAIENGINGDSDMDDYVEKIIPRHPYDGFYLRHQVTIDSRGRKICTHEIPELPPSPSSSPDPQDYYSAEESLSDSEDQSGVAGNLARVSLESGTSGEAIDDLTRRQGWEAGNIDYMGADSFDNIWTKISQTLNQPRSSPPKQSSPPKEVAAPQTAEPVAPSTEVPETIPEPFLAICPQKPEPVSEPAVTETTAVPVEAVAVCPPAPEVVPEPVATETTPDSSAPVLAVCPPAPEVIPEPVSVVTPVIENIAVCPPAPEGTEPTAEIVPEPAAEVLAVCPPAPEPTSEPAVTETVPAVLAVCPPAPEPTSEVTTESTPVVAETTPVVVESEIPVVVAEVAAEPPVPAEVPLPVVELEKSQPTEPAVVEKVESVSEAKAEESIPVVVAEEALAEIPVPVEAAEKVESVPVVPEAPKASAVVTPKEEKPAESVTSPIPAAEAPSSPAVPETTPEKPATGDKSTDSPPLANTPSKEEAPAVPAAKSADRRKPGGKLQLSPPVAADPLPTPDSELEDAATLAQKIIASELRTPTVTAPEPAASPASPPLKASAPGLAVDKPEVPTPPVGAVSLAQIGVEPTKSKEPATPSEAAPSEPPKKKIVKKVVKKQPAAAAAAAAGDAPVPPPRKKAEKKPKEN